MDALDQYRKIIRRLFTENARIPISHGNIQVEPVFDSESDHYLLMLVGRDNKRRVHGCLVHIDIIGEKLWIQRDGTERGVANDLVEAGIPRDRIVLGFRSPEMRKYTEFAAG